MVSKLSDQARFLRWLVHDGPVPVRVGLAALTANGHDIRDQGRLTHSKIQAGVVSQHLGPAPGPETTGLPKLNAPWSYIGWPSLTIPCALSSSGLPLGLQFIAMTVPQVFAMAGLCERILSFHDRPQMLES